MISMKTKAGKLTPLNNEFMISGTGMGISFTQHMVQLSQPVIQPQILSPQKPKQPRALIRVEKLPSIAYDQIKLTEQANTKTVKKKNYSLKPIKKKVNKKPKTPPEPIYIISQAPIERKEVSPLLIRTAPVKGQLMIKYSHYKDYFCIVDGVLREDVVKEQYCLSTDFNGDYKLKLRMDKDPDKKYIPQPEKGAWYGLESGKVYILEIDEDPYQINAHRDKYQPLNQMNIKQKSINLDDINQEGQDQGLNKIKDCSEPQFK